MTSGLLYKMAEEGKACWERLRIGMEIHRIQQILGSLSVMEENTSFEET